jgi:hypothetical protein
MVFVNKKRSFVNVQEVSKLTKIPVKVLIRMRLRDSGSLKAGPPFHKILNSHGELNYVYLKTEVKKWLKIRNCLITALDAAIILGISRDEVLNFYGLRGFTVQYDKNCKGRLIINNAKNLYIWMPK